LGRNDLRLDWRLDWRVDGRGRRAQAGSVRLHQARDRSRLRNDTQEAASCLCILTPGVLGPGYFREIAALLAGGAPDPARMKEIMLRHRLVPAP
jgi:hypothetical protein